MATVLDKQKASDLRVGSVFQLNNRKNGRKFIVAPVADGRNPEEIGGEGWKGSVPADLKGKLLIIVQNCGQLCLEKDREVFVEESITTK